MEGSEFFPLNQIRRPRRSPQPPGSRRERWRLLCCVLFHRDSDSGRRREVMDETFSYPDWANRCTVDQRPAGVDRNLRTGAPILFQQRVFSTRGLSP